VIIAMQELLRRTIRNSNLPQLLAKPHWLPDQLAQIDLATGMHGNVRLGILAQHPIGNGVQLISSRPHIRNAELAIRRPARPELVVLGIALPRGQRVTAAGRTGNRRLVRRRQPHQQVRQRSRWCLRVAQQ